jgi:glycosyltransferase involved in cell wall biosynthesis
MPKVSIITPCYNTERFIARTIESVQAQTLSDWEHVIVDDGSSDGSAEIAESFARRDKRIRVIRQENRGVSAARNAGFQASSPGSRYLLFLDADDTLHETMLETLASYLDNHAQVGMAYCDFTRIDENGVELSRQDDRPPRLRSIGRKLVPMETGDPETPFDTMLWWLYLPPSSALMRRTVYERLPGWDEGFIHSCEDTDFLLHFALEGCVHFVPEVLLGYRSHDSQVTKKRWFMKKQRGMLHAKWLQGIGLTEAERQIFAQQWRLYEGRLIPGYLLAEARTHLVRGSIVRAVKLALRAGAHIAIYCTAPCRRLTWPYLWYLA